MTKQEIARDLRELLEEWACDREEWITDPQRFANRLALTAIEKELFDRTPHDNED